MEIDEKRREIDRIDERIAELLASRTMIARSIAVVKTRAGLPIADAQREEEILRRVSRACRGQADDGGLVRIYETILKESRRAQSAVREEILASGKVRP